jgi:hypothetical protein
MNGACLSGVIRLKDLPGITTPACVLSVSDEGKGLITLNLVPIDLVTYRVVTAEERHLSQPL